MGVKYKLLISNHNLYKELELVPEMQSVYVGTGMECDVRLYRDLFLEPIQMKFEQNNGEWTVFCFQNLYLDVGDVRKMQTCNLKHGDVFQVRYQESDYVAFTAEFLIDFDVLSQDYECVIDISGQEEVSIGGYLSNDISMSSEYASHENLILKKADGYYLLQIIHDTYGIYKNGCHVNERAKIFQNDFFSVADCSFFLKDDMLYASNAEYLDIKKLPWKLLKESESSFVYPCFNRSTHPEMELTDQPIQILDPPPKPQKSENNLLVSLFPSLAMIALIIVIRGFMNNSSNMTYILFSVCSMSLGIVTSIISFFRNKRRYRENIEKREKDYKQYIERKKQEIDEARETERNQRNQEFPDEKTSLQLAFSFSGKLFDRSMESRNFLCIRLGTGEAEAVRKITYSEKEHIIPEDELEKLPGELAKQYQMVENVPVFCDLKKIHNLGIVGSASEQYEILKLMVLDLCVHHYSKEVQVFFVFDEQKKEQMQWVRWLPHVQNEQLGVRNIICDEASRNAQFEFLYKELNRRAATEKEQPNQSIVIFVVDPMEMIQHPVSRFLPVAHAYHVHFVFFAEYAEQLPMYCGQILETGGNRTALLTDTDSSKMTAFTYSTVAEKSIQDFALKLAPVFCREIELESSLTRNISFFQMLGIFSVDDLNLGQRWKSKDICKSMAAPLGVNSKNEIVCLDLHEAVHGPHGLVAGTTGSGKSELLQTYILSMALQFSPYEVSFLLIDFKGGGMANQLKDLPHIAGTITDIDGTDISRPLLSIRAEIDKRKAYFKQADVNNINEYTFKYRSGEIKNPLPHLIIIVDEFAELKSRQPEFMEELISAARTGRSIGIHLILATQKPAGQVSDQIWSNSRFKLCLKVQSHADSNEVLKSPVAAEIIEPGRAYFQVGNNEIFELIQSAYSNAPEKQEIDKIKGKEFRICKVDLAGRHTVIYERAGKKKEEKSRSQLQAVVDYVKMYCEKNQIRKLPEICLPPLPDSIEYPLEQKTGLKSTVDLVAEIGRYDAPESQKQGTVKLQISGKNTAIIGSSQYGKTNLLQTILRDMTSMYTPEDVNIYIMDFASTFLRNYEELPHVGGVVCAADSEKIRNLFKLLHTEMIQRKEKLIAAKVSSLSAYREAGFRDIPYIVLMIDNFTALRELYLSEEDPLLTLCRDGSSLGINVIIANPQTSGFGYRYFSTISNHIVFHCNDGDEINSVFGYCKKRPAMLPGRCLFDMDKSIYQAQIWLAFEGKREIDRSVNIKSFVDEQKLCCGHMTAKQIPEIPDYLTMKQVYEAVPSVLPKRGFAVALDYENIEGVALPFETQFLVATLGEQKEKHMRFLSLLMHDVQQHIFQRDVEVFFIDSVSKNFRKYQDMPYMKQYTSHPEALTEIVDSLRMKLQNRYELLENEGMEELEKYPLNLVIVNNRRAMDMLASTRESMNNFIYISQNLRNMKVMFVFADVDNVSMPSSDLLKRIRDEQKAFLFEPLKNIKLYNNLSIQMKNRNVLLGHSDAFYMNRDTVLRVKLVEEEL